MAIDLKGTGILDADGDILTRASGSPSGISRAVLATDAAFTAAWPTHIGITPWQPPFAHLNFEGLAFDATKPLSANRYSSGAQNDWAEYKVPLAAGTWTFTLLHDKDTNRGIYTVAVDGVTQETIDGYAATPAHQISTNTGYVVAASGVKALRLTMATKNASASAYFGSISGIFLTRTGA